MCIRDRHKPESFLTGHRMDPLSPFVQDTRGKIPHPAGRTPMCFEMPIWYVSNIAENFFPAPSY